MRKISPDILINEAENARKNSYSPYSDFCVGAALLASNGKIYTGCNVENAAFSVTNCAERTALFKAVSEGETKFSAIAVVGSRRGEAAKGCAPCGVCRQALLEFCDPEDFCIYTLGNDGEIVEYSLNNLLPCSFSKKDI